MFYMHSVCECRALIGLCVCVYVNQDDTSGDYKRTLLNLCGGDDE